MALKAAATRVLGRSSKHRIADVVRTGMLARIPTLPGDASHLRQDVDLSSIFRDHDIEKAWEKDFDQVFAHWPLAVGLGSVNRGDCRAIYYLISALKPRRVVEIGTNVAGSSMFIAAALRSGSIPDARLTTVDILDVNAPNGPWSFGDSLTAPPVEYAKRFGLTGQIDFVVEPALSFLASARADLIFLDGSHAHQDVYREVSMALDAVTRDGVILLHDYYPDGKPLFENGSIVMGPYRAIERYRREGAKNKVIPIGELPWPTRREGEKGFSSLALLLRI
jgi:predicted O-methyltransferase YrrM